MGSQKAEKASPEARGEAKGTMVKGNPCSSLDMDYLERILKILHRQGWSYGLIRYLDLVTGEELYQIDAHQGERWEKGTGRNWTEAARDLMGKISDMHTLTVH